MTQNQITATNVNEQIKHLYQTAFPENEQIPWDELVRLIGEMHLDFTAYFEGESFIGFTIVFPYEPFNWYWYFAVRPELRGQGKGQQILTALLEKYKGQSCVLDMESPRQECNNKDYEDLAGKNDVIRYLRIYVHSLSKGEASAYSLINEKGNRRYHYDDGPQIGNNVSEFTLSAAEKDHCY